MTSIREAIRRQFSPIKPLPPGTFHYQAPPDAPSPFRLHLRLEPDGRGLLIVNAATVLHLNPTAAECAYHLVQSHDIDQSAREISSRYRIGFTQARDDYVDFINRIQTMIQTPDLDPEAYLDFGRHTPYSQEVSAPYRLDCALTYRLPPGADPNTAPTKRVDRELTTEEWQTIMDKAWQVGIPHIIFTGGEPTLRDDLSALIAHAEATGQVTGLLSDGLRLADSDYLKTMLQTGLDHLLMVIQTSNDQAWQALEKTLAADLFVTVHLTITLENTDQVNNLLERMANMGVKAVSLSAANHSLRMALHSARDKAAHLGLRLVWDLPVPYSAMHPIAMETEEDAPPEGAGRAWLYVEPDGDVLPSQGINRVLGNFLRDPWEKIWGNK